MSPRMAIQYPVRGRIRCCVVSRVSITLATPTAHVHPRSQFSPHVHGLARWRAGSWGDSEMGYIIGRQVPSHCSKVIEMGLREVVSLGSNSPAH